MKKTSQFLKFVCIGLFILGRQAYSFAFEAIEDFIPFDNKPVAVLWRGVHFSPAHFEDPTKIQRYMEAHPVRIPIYCAAAHKESGVSYFDLPNQAQRGLLSQSVDRIVSNIQYLESKGPITIDKTLFSNPRHAFHQYYSNSTKFIASMGAVPERKYRDLARGFPHGNPLLSFSTEIEVACSYAYGLKNYGPTTNILMPEYDASGKPKNAILGYLEGVFLTDEAAKRSLPYNVCLHHQNGDIHIKTHFSNNILSEKEISLSGYVPGETVVFTAPVSVPSFDQPYCSVFKEEYGLSKRKYENIQGILTDAQTSCSEKQQRLEKMMKELIKTFRQDDALIYKNTISEKAKECIEEHTDSIEFVKGVVDLNGRVRIPT